jgi:hypothetical protein
MRRVRTLAGGRIRFFDSEYGETTASCMLRRFETLLMAHTFVETTVDFTLGDVLHMVYGVFDVKHGAVHFDPAIGFRVFSFLPSCYSSYGA